MIGKAALFVPAASPGMLNSSLSLDADSLMFDLEDAVSLSEKDSARELLKQALEFFDFGEKNIIVRINSMNSPYWEMDIKELPLSKINHIMVPKANPDDIKTLSRLLDEKHTDILLIPLIETAMAVEKIKDIIKSSDRVTAILFGAEDYTADMGIKRTKQGDEILYARGRIANAAHAYGIQAMDTPFTDVNDVDGLRQDAQKARSLGYTAKAAINPRQITTIKQVFAPTQEEIEYAKRVLEAVKKAEQEGKGVFAIDGKMIDAPIIKRAYQTLNDAGVCEVTEHD
jgi:citrate lyase subunit beta/citryl-CoA lyase